MRHRVIITFSDGEEVFNAGDIIDVPLDLAEQLAGYIAPIKEVGSAWLEKDELRTNGYVPDLPGEICRLTENNLPLQRTLLLRHCEGYDKNHFSGLAEEWEERAAIMEYDDGLSMEEAEKEAARRLNLSAFLDVLQGNRRMAA